MRLPFFASTDAISLSGILSRKSPRNRSSVASSWAWPSETSLPNRTAHVASSPMACLPRRTRSCLRGEAPGGVGADVVEGALPAGQVRRGGRELAAADRAGRLAHALLGGRRLFGRGPLARREARFEEA